MNLIETALVQILQDNLIAVQTERGGPLGGENSRPSLRSSSGSARQLSRLELMFPNLLSELDAADRDCCCLEPFESEHRPDPVFDSAMVLLHNVI